MKVVIQTPRLLLREMEERDASFMFDLNSDPEVVRYVGNTAFANIEEALEIVQYVRGQYTEFGMGRLVVEAKETGVPLGWCGLKYHPETGEVDLGYRFPRRFWGYGYATESGKASLEYGFNNLDLPRIIAHAMHENTASINVLEKLGFARIGEVIEYDQPMLKFEQFRA